MSGLDESLLTRGGKDKIPDLEAETTKLRASYSRLAAEYERMPATFDTSGGAPPEAARDRPPLSTGPRLIDMLAPDPLSPLPKPLARPSTLRAKPIPTRSTLETSQ